MPRWLSYTLGVVIVVIVIAAVMAPIGPMPGIRLGGTTASAPDQWSSVTLPEEVRLEASGGVLPYVVIIWVFESDNNLYVIGSPDSRWVALASENPDVRLRINDDVYAMKATRMPPGRVDLAQKYVDRYKDNYPQIVESFGPLDAFAQGAVLIELSSG
jgi:hypothetical protein